MRIIHLEDEWPGVRSIAHWLHDTIFQELPPEEKIELDLREIEQPKERIPAIITVSLKTKSGSRQLFEYLIVPDLSTLKDEVSNDDIVVVDIMRDMNGRFVSILDELVPIFSREGFNAKENWRYFSNYHEKVAESCALQGFMKKQGQDLVRYLYDKVRSDWPKP